MNKKELEVTVGEKTVKIYVTQPPAQVLSRADRYKAKTWTECIEDGIKTREQLSKFMVEKGIWSEESVTEELNIIERISDLEKQLYLGKEGKKKMLLDEGKQIAIQMRIERNKLRDLYMKRSNLEQNTAEALADNARFDYIVACCTFYENGQKVYNDIDDYNSRASDNIAFAAAGAIAEMMYGYDPKSEESLPENKWLRQFHLVNESGNLINGEEELVDINGRRINDLGHYVDKDGNRIDVNGNPLDENGNYKLTVEYEIEKKKTAAKTTKARTRKPRVKKDTTDSKSDSVV